VVRELREARNRREQRRTEEKYRSIFENAVEGIFQTGRDGRILTANPALARILGYDSPEDLMDGVGDVAEVYPNVEERREFVSRIEEEGSVSGFETKMLRKDGTSIWASLSARALRDGEGRVAGYEGFVEDVTQRTLADYALRESEERYRTAVEQAADCIFLVDAETKLLLEANAAFRNLLGYTSQELLGTSLYDFVAHDRESIDAHIERLLRERSYHIGERNYRHKDGEILSVEVNANVISHAGREVMCVVAHDITHRKATEESLRRSLDVLLALREAGQILGSTLEVPEIVTRLLTIMRGVSGLSTAVISVEDEESQLRIWRAAGLESLWPRARFAAEAEAARRSALQTGERRLFALRRPGSGDQLTGLCLPLKIQERVVGVLEAYGPESLAHGDAAEILGSLAVQAASALENARLYEELAKREKRLQDLIGKLLVAQEEERRRVAYEVHDGLTQVAVAAYQHLQAFPVQRSADPEAAAKTLEKATRLVQQTIRESRRVIADLRPTALDDFGLATAIRLRIEDLRREGWEVVYEDSLGDRRLPAAVETVLYRVAQEALVNVQKHAWGARVRVELAGLEEEVRLHIRDWGEGFNPAELTTGGPGERVGISGMRERVALIGGELEIRSEEREGTSITARVPLPDTGTER
jgi:PAS domain S-box-containing protein